MEIKKTIIIPVYDGAVSKNLLRTKFFDILRKTEGLRIVLIPPKGKIEAYENEFAIPGKVFVEKTAAWNHDRYEFFIAALFKHSIPTRFMKIRQVDWYWNKGKYFLYFGVSILRFLGRFRWWQKVLTMANLLEPIPPYIREIYDRWKPDVVFATTMIPRDEISLMRLARKDGKVVVGMAKSFDNLTSKAYLRVFPDWLIVPNPTGIEEAVTLYGYPKERVVATGIPQYDDYVRPDILENRDEFFHSLGLDKSKRTILYAPAGDWMNPNDKETLQMILDWIREGKIPNTQVLLRLHPGYESGTQELDGDPNMVMERPGKRAGEIKAFEFFKDDVMHLASSLVYSDVVVNTASTLMVEGAIFDRPVVILGFDGKEKHDYWRSVIRYYDREHCIPIIKAKGARLVTNKEELLSSILEYLDHPEHDREGRKGIVEAICYKMDGRSCDRTANVVLHAAGLAPLMLD